MLLSVHITHSGYDEVDNIEASESVRAILTERKREGAVDFFIGGDLNIELKLDMADDEHQGLDSIEWYGMYGLECRGGGEDTTACEKNELVPTTARLNCTVTSTWTNNEDNREIHTWRAWGSRVHKKQLDYHLGQNNHSFDALHACCFRINKKTVMTVIAPGGDFLELILNCNQK